MSFQAGRQRLQQSEKVSAIQQPYVYLGPQQDDIGRPLLPWVENLCDVNVVQIFELFWDDEVIDVVVEGTNRYAEVKGAGKRTAKGEAFGRPWKKITGGNVKLFLAILMYNII